MSEISFLRAGRNDGKRLSCEPLASESLYQSTIFVRRPLTRTIHVIKVGNRVRKRVPPLIILHELGIACLGPCIGSLHAPESAVAEFGRGACIYELAFPFTPKFKNTKCASTVEVPNDRGFGERNLDARVFAEMIDYVRSFGHILFDIFGMPLAILHARDVIIARASKIIIKRYDFIS